MGQRQGGPGGELRRRKRRPGMEEDESNICHDSSACPTGQPSNQRNISQMRLQKIIRAVLGLPVQ